MAERMTEHVTDRPTDRLPDRTPQSGLGRGRGRVSRRVLLSSFVGVAALGSLTAGGLAMAAGSDGGEPSLAHASARHTAPPGHGAGSLTFTVDVQDDSGVRGVRVLPWPASSKLDPTEAELRHAERATCRGTAEGTSRCTYTLKVTEKDAAQSAPGRWYVAVRAEAQDGGSVHVPRAAAFDVTR
ncbi:DUF5707 domain-containing protein [Streptomyces alfalfae]|uniref:DUF5707 domain-containing protein n=2 Tax=Streptomyces alfalfae TaxID=1642299 RepID=UPI003144D695